MSAPLYETSPNRPVTPYHNLDNLTHSTSGRATLTSGLAVVYCPWVTGDNPIFLTYNSTALTAPLKISARTPGVSFTISGDTGTPDNASVVNWMVVHKKV